MSTPNPNVVDADTLTGEVTPLRRTALALGSNLGDRLEYLQGAVDALTESPEIYAVAVSPVYESEPVGPRDQPPFLNAVLVVDTSLSVRTVLERAQAVEAAYGRVRDPQQRWGPRQLDVDVLAVGDKVVHDDDLAVPHPRLAERAFVLVPWADVDPDFDVPGLGKVADLSDAVPVEGVRLVADMVLELPT